VSRRDVNLRDDILDGVFDEAALAIYEAARESALLDVDEVAAAGNKTTPLEAKTFEIWAARVDASDIVPLVERYKREDNEGKRAGGRPPVLNTRKCIILALVLADDRTKLNIHEFAVALQHRMTEEACIALGVDGVKETGDPQQDYWNWYMRLERALHTIIDTFDAWPAKRLLHTRAEREKAIADRDPGMRAVKEPRAREFTNTMLDVSIQAIPEPYASAWKGALSADQSAIPAPSQRMPWKRDHELEGSPEVPDEIEVFDEDGNAEWVEAPRKVLEIDATPYPRDKGKQDKDFNGRPSEFDHAYAANIMMMMTEPDDPYAHPQMVVAASLHKFGRSIAEHTIAGVDWVLEKGRPVKRLTVDRGYSAGISLDEFHKPLAQRGVGLVIDYAKWQLTARKETVAGGLQIEGDVLCPATPVDLRTLSEDARTHKITPKEYFAKVLERQKYRARPKGAPDENGGVYMFCPARRESPMVTCEYVHMHAKASRNPAVALKRPHIDPELLPGIKDTICRDETFRLEWDDALETRQVFQFATPEWLKTYSHDRQSQESFNVYLKDVHGLGDPDRRQMRGLAAQNFIFTMVLTVANFSRLNKFLADRAAGIEKPEAPRARDVNGDSNYRRFYKAPRRRKGLTLKEQRAITAEVKKQEAEKAAAASKPLGRARGRKAADAK